MGIRFRCHHCESELHVKDFQAGKRGRCPECKGKFRIPLADAEHSLTAEFPLTEMSGAPAEMNASPDQELVESASSSDTATDANAAPREDDMASAPAPSLPTRAEPRQPQILNDSPDARWLVRPATGSEYGPAPSSAIWQWLNEHRIGSDSLIWREGWPEWRVAAEVFSEFFVAPEKASYQEADGTATASASAAEIAAKTVVSSSGSSLDKIRIRRKKKRSRNYAVLIVSLSLLMIVLVSVLVVVLLRQK